MLANSNSAQILDINVIGGYDFVNAITKSPTDGTGVTTSELDSTRAHGASSVLCQFPGCTNAPSTPGAGAGRPPRYCGKTVNGTEHNRQNARTARLALRGSGVPEQAITGTEPVTVARGQASLLVDRVETASTGLAALLGQTLDRLAAIGDLAAVEAQLESVTANLQAQASTARAQAAAAEQARLRAETRAIDADEQRAEADEIATTALTAQSTAEEALQSEQQAHALTREALAEAVAETARITAELEQQINERAQDNAVAQAAAETAAREAATLTARTQDAETRTRELRAELDQQTLNAATAAARADAEAGAAATRLSELGHDLHQARAQADQHATVAADRQATLAEVRAELAAERRALQVAQEHAAARITDLQTTRDELKTEIDTLKAKP